MKLPTIFPVFVLVFLPFLTGPTFGEEKPYPDFSKFTGKPTPSLSAERKDAKQNDTQKADDDDFRFLPYKLTEEEGKALVKNLGEAIVNENWDEVIRTTTTLLEIPVPEKLQPLLLLARSDAFFRKKRTAEGLADCQRFLSLRDRFPNVQKSLLGILLQVYESGETMIAIGGPAYDELLGREIEWHRQQSSWNDQAGAKLYRFRSRVQWYYGNATRAVELLLESDRFTAPEIERDLTVYDVASFGYLDRNFTPSTPPKRYEKDGDDGPVEGLSLQMTFPADRPKRQAILADLSEALKRTAGEPASLPLRGNLLELRGDHFFSMQGINEALADYTEAARIGESEELYEKRRCITDFLEWFRSRIVELTDEIKAGSAEAEKYYERAALYCSVNEVENALRDVNKAIDLDPTLESAYRLRLILYFLRDNCRAALADATELLRLNDQSAETYFARGQLYLWMKEAAKASVDFEKAAMLDPAYEVFYRRYHRAFFDLDYPAEDALAYLTEKLEQDPDNLQLLHFRALRYAMAGRVSECLADADRMVALGGREQLSQRITLAVYCFERHPDRARRENVCEWVVTDATQLIETAGEDEIPTLVVARGMMLWYTGAHAEALEDFEEILRLVPNAPMTHLRCVLCRLSLAERTDDAEEKERLRREAESHLDALTEEATAEDPALPGMQRFCRGKLHESRGETEAAAAAFFQAKELGFEGDEDAFFELKTDPRVVLND